MHTITISIVALASAGLLALQAAAPPAADAAPRTPAGKPGPWDHELLVQRIAADGTTSAIATFGRADVSSVVRLKDGRLVIACQAFPADDAAHFNRIAVRCSGDDGRTWGEPQPIVMANLDAAFAAPFDPALVVLPDGRVRMYFITHTGTDAAPGQTAVHSAISTDAVRYDYEPGVRFTVPGRVVVDCAAALHDGVFHLVVPDNGTPAEFLGRRRSGEPQPGGNGYHATSTDGLAFTRATDLRLPSTRDRWFGNLLSDGTQLLFFGTGPGPWPVTSADGMQWAKAAAPVRMPGVDPSVVRLRDGSWLVVATREPAPAKP
ncbi:MAG: hypothetical protein RI990_573 [Planctomycetota bacterium]|jgi:hypothetical protein